MSAASRRYVLARRGAATSDVSGMGVEKGEASLDEAIKDGWWKVNGIQQVGIATAQESGLSSDRFPIRVVIVPPNGQVDITKTVAVFHYWPITDHTDTALTFDRKVKINDVAVRNYYLACPDLDTLLWDSYNKRASTFREADLSQEFGAVVNAAYVQACVPNLNDEAIKLLKAALLAIFTTAGTGSWIPRIQVGDNAVIKNVPAGAKPPVIATYAPDTIIAMEVAAGIVANEKFIRTTYEDLDEGTLALGAYCMSLMFRYGLYESYEHKEYNVMVCEIKDAKTLTIKRLINASGAATIQGFAVGSDIDLTRIRPSKKMTEMAMGCIVAAGLNHYSYNHTTGGQVAAGTLLTILANAGIVTDKTSDDTAKRVTDLFYQALHPVNKRAIANIFFPDSKVTTHGKDAFSRPYSRFESDQFISIRSRPHPAGSHKAYICALVLKRVTQAHLAAFLPWAASLGTCIAHCREVLTAGARAHMGANYYTGERSVQQSSQLDNYLPELAAFIQNMSRNDSIAMSPHLGADVASRSDVNWVSMIKSLKAADMSKAKVEDIQNYLIAAGAGVIDINFEDPSSFGSAIVREKESIDAINAFL